LANDFASTQNSQGFLKQDYEPNPVSKALKERRLKAKAKIMDQMPSEGMIFDSNGNGKASRGIG